MSTSRSLYRPLFQGAWEKTRQKPAIWILGFITTFFATGGIMNILWQSGLKVTSGLLVLKTLVSSAPIAPPYDWIQALASVSPFTLSLFVTLWALILVFACVFLPIAQGALLVGLSERKLTHVGEMIHQAVAKFFQLFPLALMAFLFHHVVLFGIISALFLLTETTALWTSSMSLGFLLLLIPIGIGVHFVHLLSALEIMRRNVHVFEAIHDALSMVRKHLLVCVETGLLVSVVQSVGFCLFLVLTQLVGMITLGFVGLAGLLKLPAFEPMILFTSHAFILVGFVFFLAGMTTWSHAVWVRLAELTGFAQSHLLLRSRLVRWFAGR